MLNSIGNYDLICYQLRNNLYSRLQNPLKVDLDLISKKIKLSLKSDTISISNELLSKLFNFRIKAIKWLFSESNFNYNELLDEIYPQIEDKIIDKKMNILKDNILFALRCSKRVAESILPSIEESQENQHFDLNKFTEITYDQLITSISYSIPDEDLTQKFIDWVNSSLEIEYVMLATDIIIDEKLDIPSKTIKKLAFTVADKAQVFCALATEFGFIKSKNIDVNYSNIILDKKFIEEQKQLADLDLFESFK